ncbi:uncharacterized protein LOC123257406 [Drosophila ananassae]|uniref:uncharacterized protein LOC123257406 n=1 Tax=Drosophila ananassae TaxID=7217 RepID=UPI001CFFEFC1|nr:uncharacterized protein LOC123257406 [Drosophila ananassae]
MTTYNIDFNLMVTKLLKIFLRKYLITYSKSLLICGINPIEINQSRKSSDRGRPKLSLAVCSERTKRRRIAEISEVNQSAADDIRSVCRQPNPSIFPAKECEVVALITEANLTKQQYEHIKSFVNSKIEANFFPCYNNILKEKQESYPELISVTESDIEVSLQSLLDHTASRILKLQSDVTDKLDESHNYLTLKGKWGFDGSSGHSEYKQKFENNNLEDSCLFVTSYVPLQLFVKSDNDKEQKIIWKNPRPSSTRYCRPIRIQFQKESVNLIKNEEEYFKNKIQQLTPTEFKTATNRKFCVDHILQLTMVDGKVCNALSETSSSKCYICQARPTEMNDIDKCLQKKVRTDRYEFGLSPLHAYIRFFEYFLHVSYKLEIRQWQIRGKENKELVQRRKQNIQSEFREKMGLIVDKPRTGGSGNSNDGNTARTFFNNPHLSAEITGIEQHLIEKCATVLQALSSGYKINVEKFRKLALDTARELTTKYSWYYLPSSVHKILIHAPDVIKYALVSIGELSEEAAESRNKDVKKYRLNHTRKTSRIATNRDLINRLLLTSDPFITGQRKLPSKCKTILSKSVFDLLE